MRGGSCIINPLGRVLAAPSFDGECILTADIDLDEIPRAKYDFDVVGHYARPDVFRLSVNERRTPACYQRSRVDRGCTRRKASQVARGADSY